MRWQRKRRWGGVWGFEPQYTSLIPLGSTPLNTGFISEPCVYNHPEGRCWSPAQCHGQQTGWIITGCYLGSLTAGRSWAEPARGWYLREALLSLTRPGLETLGLSPTIHVVMEKSLYFLGPSFSHLQNEKAGFDERFSKLSCWYSEALSANEILWWISTYKRTQLEPHYLEKGLGLEESLSPSISQVFLALSSFSRSFWDIKDLAEGNLQCTL